MHTLVLADENGPTVPRADLGATGDASDMAIPIPSLGVFSVLPNDIIWELLRFVGDARDLCRLSQTSSAFATLASADELWELLTVKRFSESQLSVVLGAFDSIGGDDNGSSGQPLWKRAYALAHKLYVSRRGGIGSQDLVDSSQASSKSEGSVQPKRGGVLYKVGQLLWGGNPRPISFIMLGSSTSQDPFSQLSFLTPSRIVC
jgi:F-box-like